MPRSGLLRPSGPGYPKGGLHGQIVHEIGRQILSGQIQPGQVVPFDKGLHASRTVLREAIKVLVAKGLVESRPKTGTRVRSRLSWNLLDPDVLDWQRAGAPPAQFLSKLTEVRRIVEPAAAQLAGERATAKERADIAQAYREMESALFGAKPDYDTFDLADMRFHRAIMLACHNDLLGRMSGVVFGALLVSFQATSRLPGSQSLATESPRHPRRHPSQRRQTRRKGDAAAGAYDGAGDRRVLEAAGRSRAQEAAVAKQVVSVERIAGPSVREGS